jgi:hypothetical protein
MQMSADVLQVEEGSLYPVLYRLAGAVFKVMQTT